MDIQLFFKIVEEFFDLMYTGGLYENEDYESKEE